MQHAHTERDYLDICHSLVVLGGTFDPIHMGHLAIAEAVYHQLKPQRVLFIPSGQSAHKQDRQITDAEHRYNMTALATCEYPPFDISRLELNRPGPSYTIDTARALQAACPAGVDISFIVGADALKDILSWKNAGELLQICKFVVVPRPGYEKGVAPLADSLTTNHGANIHLLDGPLLDISSTGIRERLKNIQDVQGLIPRPVEDYVRLNGLYSVGAASGFRDKPNLSSGPVTTPIPFNFEAAYEALSIRLSPRRFKHTMGVVEEAKRLAVHYGQDVEKAGIAALLHDCTKEYSADKKRNLCKLWGVQLDKTLEANIDLTHSLLSAESAQRDFNIHDPEILQAIRYHTTGHSGMTMLDKLIMLADYIEPYRVNWGPINEMRRLALTDVNQALIIGTKYTIKEEKQAGKLIHPWSLDMLKELGGKNEKRI